MNILLVTAYFSPDMGSAANLFYDLGKKLSQKGHSVTILTSFPSYHVKGKISQYKGEKFIEENIEDMKVFRVKVLQLPRYIPAMRALWQFAMAYQFIRSIRNIGENDIALVYSPPLPLGFVGSALRKKTGAHFILNVQDLFPQSAIDLGILKNKMLIRCFEYLERKIYRLSEHITVHSVGNKNHVAMIGVDKKNITIIPNWIDTDLLQPGEKINSFSETYNLTDKFVISFAGIIGYSQDVDVILDAAELLREKKDILFLIVGDGVEKERLVLKAKDANLENVLFLPMQQRDVYSQILHSSDICLSTLRKEVMSPVVPSKILSVMAAGKPLIACMNLEGDAPKIIEESKCGIVLAAGDHKGLTDAIVEMYNSTELRKDYGNNGYSYCLQEFSLDVCANRYIKLFEKLG